MKSIVARLTPNNQVKISYCARPSRLGEKSKKDGREAVERERIAQRIAEIDKMRNIMSMNCSIKSNRVCISSVNQGILDFSLDKGTYCSSPICTEFYEAPYCEFPSTLSYVDVTATTIEVVTEKWGDFTERLRQYLDIIKKSQQVKVSHSCWGEEQKLKAFTKNARQRILESGAIVDSDCSLDSSFELTLTLPGSTRESYSAVSRWSGWIVNRMTQVIRRFEAKGYKIYWFFVWEHQKRGALHQHWCIATPHDPRLAKLLCRRLRSKWFKCLLEIQEKDGIDCFKRGKGFGTWRNRPRVWQYSYKVIRKSVAAYFSKYASKNVEVSEYNKEKRKAGVSESKFSKKAKKTVKTCCICPSRYWGSCRRIKELIKKRTVTLTVLVESEQEARWLNLEIRHALSDFSAIAAKYQYNYTVADPKTSFIYAQGFVENIYFSPETFASVSEWFKAASAVRELNQDFSQFYLNCLA